MGGVGGPCDYSVTPESKSLFLLYYLGTSLVFGWGFGLGLDNYQCIVAMMELLIATEESLDTDVTH